MFTLDQLTHIENVNNTIEHGYHITINPRNWCLFYHLNEAGLQAIQIGCIIIEIW